MENERQQTTTIRDTHNMDKNPFCVNHIAVSTSQFSTQVLIVSDFFSGFACVVVIWFPLH